MLISHDGSDWVTCHTLSQHTGTKEAVMVLFCLFMILWRRHDLTQVPEIWSCVHHSSTCHCTITSITDVCAHTLLPPSVCVWVLQPAVLTAVTPTCCNNKPTVGVLVGGCYTFSLIMVLFLYISWFWSFLKGFNKLFPALLHLKQTEAGQPCLLWPHLVSWRLQNEEADV